MRVRCERGMKCSDIPIHCAFHFLHEMYEYPMQSIECRTCSISLTSCIFLVTEQVLCNSINIINMDGNLRLIDAQINFLISIIFSFIFFKQKKHIFINDYLEWHFLRQRKRGGWMRTCMLACMRACVKGSYDYLNIYYSWRYVKSFPLS